MGINSHLDDFMRAFPHEALTFDDVSLVTRYADILPHETRLKTRLTRNVSNSIPFVSAAMDTVTESDMAIAMAMLGGIGVVHKNLAPSEQAELVRGVKHYLNGLIESPVTFKATDTLAHVHESQRQRGLAFSGFPILDENERFVGILTGRDIKFCSEPGTQIRDVMTTEVITAPPGTDLQQAYTIMQKHRIGKLPIIDGEKLAGLYSFRDVRSLIENQQPLYNRDSQYRLRVAAAVGPGDEERVAILAEEDTDVLVVDTAHGHSQGVLDMTAWTKKNYPDIDVVAGNIATGEAALALRDAGADAVKVGIGPGSICTTRVVAGVGIPQVSAIYACASALEGSIPVIADGGIRHSGDVAKAIVAGADTVMMGSILAGTQESPGEKIIYQGRQYVVYRGMGSLEAMKTREGSRERYGQRAGDEEDLVPQGIEGMVPHAGSVEKVMKQFCGGLQASLGYCGCSDLDALRAEGHFVRITSAGVTEAHPHNVTVTKEAPNYRT